MAANAEPSSLLLQEMFSQGDDRFVEALSRSSDAKKVASLVDRWTKDVRPWARKMMLRFLGQPMVERHKALLIKRIYKYAEHAGDDEIIGACMAGFDRLIRRKVVWRHEWVNQQVQRYQTLRAPRQQRTYSYATSCYLRRRAWRYFRRKGFSDPAAYVASLSKALCHYQDSDVALGQNMLDCWGLMHACFGKSGVLVFNRRYANLVPERSLGELSAAPMFERHWRRAESADALLQTVLSANSRVVRVWAIQVLRAFHLSSLTGINADLLLALLDRQDPEVQRFGAELLSKAQGLEKLPLETWLRLLRTRNLEALALVCEVFAKHVTPDRVTLDQAVQLTAVIAVPVARLGWGFLRAKSIDPMRDRQTLSRLADIRCQALGEEVAGWALGYLGQAGVYDLERVVPFFDSLLATVRRGAIAWLKPQTPGYSDPMLYARLIESPDDDVRLFLVAELSRRSKIPGAGDDSLSLIWTAVLLNIHRGGRAKLTALRQISAAIVDRPQAAQTLLPVLAVAIRSVRGPEARHGLAAVVAAVEANPALAELVAKQFPELKFIPVEGESR